MDKRKYLDKCRENCHFRYREGNSNDNRFLTRNHGVQKGVAQYFSVAGKKKKNPANIDPKPNESIFQE